MSAVEIRGELGLLVSGQHGVLSPADLASTLGMQREKRVRNGAWDTIDEGESSQILT